ncbi:hypothetical protein [Novosphingobium sp. HII-3]|uniref:putative PDDEXK endonuclease n=1 Tax=Novosphingobium sp. HII-3 TaxID=2075565 RepID=UPI000CDA3A9A|nr:hypothetical protein [Novosphingobium sp. HII-3]
MSGRHSRNKGANYERELVNALRDRGLTAQRVPLSGATEYAKGDVEVTAGFDGKTIFRGECKRRSALPAWIERALGENDFLAMREDRGTTLIVLRLDTFGDLLQ